MEVVNSALAKATRRKVHEREYLVAPVSLIVPGVLNGSLGPLYYPPEEIAANPDAWNGMPLLVNHPDEGTSARTPEIMQSQQVGSIYNVTANGKLAGEAWIDVEICRRIDNRILAALESGKKVEVSTGLKTENHPVAGTHNGKSYTHVARNYRPDHLAILPDGIGACSIEAGCGLLNEEPKCPG